MSFRRCILSKFYIKPQLLLSLFRSRIVVSYRNSTSNHNRARNNLTTELLYLIEILHQTTTRRESSRRTLLYLIEILHQTTTKTPAGFFLSGCILSKFYIKPQRTPLLLLGTASCILSKFYIKPQQKQMMRFSASCCILSKFYIKPQLPMLCR